MDIKELEKKVNANSKKIDNNKERIEHNHERISQNTGALDILRGFKFVCKILFIMWLITFVTLLYFIFN